MTDTKSKQNQPNAQSNLAPSLLPQSLLPESLLPQSYEEWVQCITVKCGLALTPTYIEQRISALQDTTDFRTKQYIELYGNQYHALVLSWFVQAKEAHM